MTRVTCRMILFVLVASLAAITSRNTYATDIEVDTSTGGGMVAGYYGFYDPNIDDPPASYPETIPPDIDPNVGVYFVGRSTSSPLKTGFSTPERRVAFLFDMAGVAASIPSGEVIDDVVISLELLSGGSSALVNFATPFEVVEFTSTPVPPDVIADPNLLILDPNDGPAGVVIWDALGTGDPYGEFLLPDPTEPNLPPIVLGTQEIPLPLAIPDLETSILAGDIFVVSMRLKTFDPGPIGPTADLPTVEPIDPQEYVFGGTDVPGVVPYPKLIITTVPIPEPASLALGALGVAVIGLRRRMTFW